MRDHKVIAISPDVKEEFERYFSDYYNKHPQPHVKITWDYAIHSLVERLVKLEPELNIPETSGKPKPEEEQDTKDEQEPKEFKDAE